MDHCEDGDGEVKIREMEAPPVTYDDANPVATESLTTNAGFRRRVDGHMPQLDGLRALAVVAVAWWHWMPRFCFHIPCGAFGVELFFVLSGFLITGLLLDARNDLSAQSSRWFVLRQFYIRRFLRIFPLYYLAVVVAIALNWEPSRQLWSWLCSYTTNVYVYLHGQWIGRVSHFWSLAVEEQFYLGWPFLILFLPRRLLKPVIVLSIGIAPAFWSAFALAKADNGFVRYLTPACLDCLGTGALLALVLREAGMDATRKLARQLLVIGLAGCVIAFGFKAAETFQQISVSLVFGWLVLSAAAGFKGLIGRVLEWRPMLYLGRISYGLYVIHMLAFFVAPSLANLRAPEFVKDVIRLPVLALITLSCAAISWHVYEKPLNDLKRLFPYHKKALAAVHP